MPVYPQRAAHADAAVIFGALLVSIALRPLAKPLGFYGDVVVDACALRIAEALPRGAFTPLERS